MAVTRVLAASLNAGAVISNVAGRISAVHVNVPTDGTTGNTFVMLYDKNSAPTGGGDTPIAVMEIYSAASPQSGTKGTHKLLFPGGGLRTVNGIGLFVATAFNGGTGVTTTAPNFVDVFFEPGN